MKNKDIVSLSSALDNVASLSGVKFAYVVAKNNAKVKQELESFKGSTKSTKEFTEFERKRIELAERFSKKDENGKIVINGNEYVIEDKEAFDVEFSKLKEERKEVIEAREKQLKDFDALLEEESKLDLMTIKLDDVPTNISSGQMTGIINIIEE